MFQNTVRLVSAPLRVDRGDCDNPGKIIFADSNALPLSLEIR